MTSHTGEKPEEVVKILGEVIGSCYTGEAGCCIILENLKVVIIHARGCKLSLFWGRPEVIVILGERPEL